MKYFIFAAFILTSCGKMDHQHKGTVDFKITVDQVVLTKYFTAKCKHDMPEATPEEIDACVVLDIGQFLDAVSAIAGSSE